MIAPDSQLTNFAECSIMSTLIHPGGDALMKLFNFLAKLYLTILYFVVFAVLIGAVIGILLLLNCDIVIAAAFLPFIAIGSGFVSAYLNKHIALILNALRRLIILPASRYYKTERFLSLKEELSGMVNEYNELNAHLDEVKKRYYFNPQLARSLPESVRRNENGDYTAKDFLRSIDCDREVYVAAHDEPFKFFCHFYNIKKDARTLRDFEQLYQDMNSILNGYLILLKKRRNILTEFKKRVPFIIRVLGDSEFYEELGISKPSLPYFHEFDFTDKKGHEHRKLHSVVRLELTLDTVEKFIAYLAHACRKNGSINEKRVVMSADLIKNVTERDNNTCQRCGATADDDTLLLALDYLDKASANAPLGTDDIHTVCWRCNHRYS